MHVSRPALGASMRSMGLIREGVTSDAMPVVSLEQQAKRHRVREAVSKEHSTEAHKRYVRPHQRTTEYSNQVQRSRQAQAYSLLDLVRADPMTLTQWMVDCGLFDRLAGDDCPFGPQCTTPASRSFPGHQEASPVLGPLCNGSVKEIEELTEEARADINRRTARYRCGECRRPIIPTHGHPMFPRRSGPSAYLFVFWCTAEGWDKTIIIRTTGYGEDSH